MKKIVLLLTLMCLMLAAASSSVLALEPYSGMPSTPYIIFGFVDWNAQMLSGTSVQLTNQNTGFTQTVVTDGSGYWQTEATSWLTNVAARPPVMYNDVISVKVLDGCGTGDTCETTFNAFTGTDMYHYTVAARVDFSITGTLSCPPTSCPSCGGGGSSSSSGGYCSYTEEICLEKFPVEDVVCDCGELADCPAEKVCPITSCPSCPEVDECPEVPVDESGSGLLSFLLGLIGGGAGIYYFKRKDAKMPNGTFVKFGGAGTTHMHRGLRGYHKPSTSHREKHERHPKGELDPKYEKDVDGVYKYVP